MWQSKKNHTSFVKSFLHHEPEAGSDPASRDGDRQENTKDKVSKDKAGSVRKSFFDLSSLEDDSVSLKVLGI